MSIKASIFNRKNMNQWDNQPLAGEVMVFCVVSNSNFTLRQLWRLGVRPNFAAGRCGRVATAIGPSPEARLIMLGGCWNGGPTNEKMPKDHRFQFIYFNF